MSIIATMIAGDVRERRQNLRVTVLHRPGGVWYDDEVSNLANKLRTEVAGIGSCPEHLILFGHHTKEETLRAIGGGTAYTATQVTGADNPLLPFSPGFCS